MPRKTDSNNPADWLFMAASDLEDADWPSVRATMAQVASLLDSVQNRVTEPDRQG